MGSIWGIFLYWLTIRLQIGHLPEMVPQDLRSIEDRVLVISDILEKWYRL